MNGQPSPVQIVVVTGLSGAGRSTAAKCLEDLGWFVVDNLPPGLLTTMAELGGRSAGAVSKIAAVVDVRSRAFSSRPATTSWSGASRTSGGRTRCRGRAGWSAASCGSASSCSTYAAKPTSCWTPPG